MYATFRIITDKCVAIGHITAEAMDTSKASFLPAQSTKQALEELKAVSGPFDSTLVQKVQSTVTARDAVKTQGYDTLVCLKRYSVIFDGTNSCE